MGVDVQANEEAVQGGCDNGRGRGRGRGVGGGGGSEREGAVEVPVGVPKGIEVGRGSR